MHIVKKQEGSAQVLALEGRLDTNTSRLLENEFETLLNGGSSDVIVDFSDVEYVSSAGLRVLLGAQKKVDKIHGKLQARNVNSDVMEVFSITGFTDVLTIV